MMMILDDDGFLLYTTCRILAEAGINALPKRRVQVKTLLDQTYIGDMIDEDNVVCVSVIRAGDALLEAVRECIPQAPVGKSVSATCL